MPSAPFPGCGPQVVLEAPLPAQPGTPQRLPFRAKAYHALAADLSGNGLEDIILTSHHSNGAAVYPQTAPRVFAAPQQLDAVGFHPDEWIRMSDSPLRLLNLAEGRGELQSYRAETRGGNLELVLDQVRPSPAPFKAALARDKDGLALGVARYYSPLVEILRGFDPLELASASTETLELGTGGNSAVTDLQAIDLDGDGSDELLAAVPRDRALQLVKFTAEGQPLNAELLYRFPLPKGQRGPYAIRPLDIECDGWPDLLATSQTHDQAFVLINRTEFEFDVVAFAVPDWGILDLAMGADADGTTYLLLAGQKHLALYRNPDFPRPRDPIVIEGAGFAAPKVQLSDLDRDGRLDAIITRLKEEDSNLIIYGPLAEAFTQHASQIVRK